MRIRIGLLGLLLGASSFGYAQIAFVKRNTLFVLPCDGAGRPTGSPFRVCRLWRHYKGDGITIGWTPEHRIVVIHSVDAWNGPKRFGLSTKERASGISIVDATPDARIQYLAAGDGPLFTPDGRQMIYSSGDMDGDIWCMDLRTRTRRIIQRHSVAPELSRDGRQIASIRVDPGRKYECHVEVRRFPSGDLLKQFEPAVNPTGLQFSPDGSALAIHYHLSRPLTGHSIFMLGRKDELALDAPDRFAPPIIDDWSPDGRWMLCSWRIVDPNNDGASIREYVGLTPFGPGKARQIAMGHDSSFSADGKHVLYLTSDRAGADWPRSLVRKALNGNKVTRLVAHIGGFSVYQPWGGKLAGIYFHDPIDI